MKNEPAAAGRSHCYWLWLEWQRAGGPQGAHTCRRDRQQPVGVRAQQLCRHHIQLGHALLALARSSKAQGVQRLSSGQQEQVGAGACSGGGGGGRAARAAQHGWHGACGGPGPGLRLLVPGRKRPLLLTLLVQSSVGTKPRPPNQPPSPARPALADIHASSLQKRWKRTSRLPLHPLPVLLTGAFAATWAACRALTAG